MQHIEIPSTSHSGIKEHFLRAGLFFDTGMRTEEPCNRYRFLIAAVYSCRAIAELMLDEKNREELGISADQLRKKLVEKLPYFELVYRIRIHDFHRFGLLPPSQSLNQFLALGPFKLTARNGVASLQITEVGPVEHRTGKSDVDPDRPVFIVNDSFLDEMTNQYIPLDKVVRDYLSGVPAAVDVYEAQLRSSVNFKSGGS